MDIKSDEIEPIFIDLRNNILKITDLHEISKPELLIGDIIMGKKD